MSGLERLQAYLRQNGVSYHLQHHVVAYTAHQLATCEHVPARMLAKVVMVLADGFIGQMMEPVEFPPVAREAPLRPWAVEGTAVTRKNLVTSIYLEPDQLETHVRYLARKYNRAQQQEARAECWRTEDAEIILAGYGITARILRAAAERARARTHSQASCGLSQRRTAHTGTRCDRAVGNFE